MKKINILINALEAISDDEEPQESPLVLWKPKWDDKDEINRLRKIAKAALIEFRNR